MDRKLKCAKKYFIISLLTFQDSNEDSVSQSSSHVDGNPTAPSQVAKPSPQKRKNRKSRQEWEIIEGLRDGQKCADKPERHSNFLMKRRKWPMKGWHKVGNLQKSGEDP